MSQVVVSLGQSLVDVCLQELGSIAALQDLATANGLSITDELHAGQRLTVPASLLSTPALVSYYAGRGYRVNVPDPQNAPAVVTPPADKPHDFLPSDFLRADVY